MNGGKERELRNGGKENEGMKLRMGVKVKEMCVRAHMQTHTKKIRIDSDS